MAHPLRWVPGHEVPSGDWAITVFALGSTLFWAMYPCADNDHAASSTGPAPGVELARGLVAYAVSSCLVGQQLLGNDVAGAADDTVAGPDRRAEHILVGWNGGATWPQA